MSEAVVPSDVFFSNIHISPHDPWQLDKPVEPHRPYQLRKGQQTVVVTFRMPDNQYAEMQQIVQQRVIPGIDSYADFNVMATAYTLARFHELGIEGFSGHKVIFDNDLRQHRSEERRSHLESNDDTIACLKKDRDIFGMRETLRGMLDYQDTLSPNEPEPFLQRIAEQIKELKELLTEQD